MPAILTGNRDRTVAAYAEEIDQTVVHLRAILNAVETSTHRLAVTQGLHVPFGSSPAQHGLVAGVYELCEDLHDWLTGANSEYPEYIARHADQLGELGRLIREQGLDEPTSDESEDPGAAAAPADAPEADEVSVHLAAALLVDEHITRAGELIGEIQTRFEEIQTIMRELVGGSGLLCDWNTDADAPLLPNVFGSSPYGVALFHTVVDAWKHNVLGDLDDALEKTYLDWRQVQEICRLAVEHERMLSAHCS